MAICLDSFLELIDAGHTEEVETHLRMHSGFMDAQDSVGWTPFHLAAWNGDMAMVELLLRFGSGSLDVFNKVGWTPLYMALLSSRKKTVHTLKAVGASTTLNVRKFNPDQIEMLRAPIAEAEVIAIRNRIYFDRSLVSILLFLF